MARTPFLLTIWVIAFVACVLVMRPGTDLTPVAVAGTSSADQSLAPTATPDQGAATPSSPSAAAPGTVLASDTLSSPNGGLFHSGSNPRWTWGYSNGHYEIASNSPLQLQSQRTLATGDFADIIVSVDTQIGPNGDFSTMGGVGCRVGPNGQGGYEFRYVFQNNNWFLMRLDFGATALPQLGAGTITSVAPFMHAVHHLMISCQGSTISASVDGVQTVSVQDPNYSHGQAEVVAVAGSSSAIADQAYATNVDVLFNNFAVTQP